MLIYIIILFICAILIISIGRIEQFATRQEKAQAIFTWFKNNPVPTYIQYKNDMPRSNIVEYEDALQLLRNGILSLDAIKKII